MAPSAASVWPLGAFSSDSRVTPLRDAERSSRVTCSPLASWSAMQHTDQDRQAHMLQSCDPPTQVIQVDQFEGASGFAEAAGGRRTLEIKGVGLIERVTLSVSHWGESSCWMWSLSSHPGGSPEEEEDPAKDNDRQDDQHQDHIPWDKRARVIGRGGRIQPSTF